MMITSWTGEVDVMVAFLPHRTGTGTNISLGPAVPARAAATIVGTDYGRCTIVSVSRPVSAKLHVGPTTNATPARGVSPGSSSSTPGRPLTSTVRAPRTGVVAGYPRPRRQDALRWGSARGPRS